MKYEPLADKYIEEGDAFIGRLVEVKPTHLRFIVDMETVESIEEIPLDWCDNPIKVLDFIEHLRRNDDYYVLERFGTLKDEHPYVLEIYNTDKSFLCSIWNDKVEG